MTKITIIDYGTSNLGSMQNMLKKVGIESNFAENARDVLAAEKIILPGVGAFDFGMNRLRESGMHEALDEKVLDAKTPVLGVCLGMQMMAQSSEEGTTNGLGWLKARAVRFRPQDHNGMSVPHMGWNETVPLKASRLLEDTPDGLRFYFANSYHLICEQPDDVLLQTSHAGFKFTSAVERNHIRGAQFHPEKSHRFGKWLLGNFAREC